MGAPQQGGMMDPGMGQGQFNQQFQAAGQHHNMGMGGQQPGYMAQPPQPTQNFAPTTQYVLTVIPLVSFVSFQARVLARGVRLQPYLWRMSITTIRRMNLGRKLISISVFYGFTWHFVLLYCTEYSLVAHKLTFSFVANICFIW